MGKPNERRRQKALARKKAKRKSATRRQLPAVLQNPESSLFSLSRSSVHECLLPVALFELGIGNVIFSRHLASGRIAMAVFLVDVFCLGVKDAFYAIVEPEEYANMMAKIKSREDLYHAAPSCARRLVEGAVEYAGRLGLQPHRDYHTAKKIFGDVDPAECSCEYEYGYQGKPFYVSGPHDTPAKAHMILDTVGRALASSGPVENHEGVKEVVG